MLLHFFFVLGHKAMCSQKKRIWDEAFSTAARDHHQTSSLFQLPEDCILFVFSFLGYTNRTFHAFANTCKKWYTTRNRFSMYCLFRIKASKICFIQNLNPAQIELISDISYSIGFGTTDILRCMPNLRSLTIDDSSDLSRLQQVRSLEILSLAAYQWVVWPPNLTHLSLCGLYFQQCSSLVKLRVEAMNLSKAYIAQWEFDNCHVEKFIYPKLEVLDLSNFDYPQYVPPLLLSTSLRQLRLPMLTIADDILSKNIFDAFQFLPCLEILEVDHLKSLEVLTSLTTLTHLSCSFGLFSDIDALYALTLLQYLNLFSSQNLVDLAAIEKLPNLTALCLENSPRLFDLTPLHHHRSLSLLDLRCCPQLRFLEFIGYMPALAQVHCHDNAFQQSAAYRALRNLRPKLFPRSMSQRGLKPDFYF